MTSDGNSFNYFTGNRLTKFICRMYKNYYSEINDISKFSTVIEQQCPSAQGALQPLSALRRLPHLAYRSYATAAKPVRYDPQRL